MAPATITKDDKRARILDAAELKFAADGFDATPTASIAIAAEVPKGLVFYYFPRKIDILRALLDERLPTAPLCRVSDAVRPGDPAGSLLRLARKLGIGEHESVVLRTIIFREVATHPEVRDHVRALREGLLELTESVLDAAVDHVLDPVLRRQAAHTYVAVMLDEANARRFDGPVPDLAGAAKIVAGALA
ncbi:MAG TPA: TetR/AcrR family transcriptional regulator [Nocardioidaceae bacterium]|nr:TetR/AcrR family transcriptional regulator [Nocardioidaceae bacterium]